MHANRRLQKACGIMFRLLHRLLVYEGALRDYVGATSFELNILDAAEASTVQLPL